MSCSCIVGIASGWGHSFSSTRTHTCSYAGPDAFDSSLITVQSMFFPGSTQQRKVSLGGRSRGEETREQTLERTRAEREKRQRAKQETKSAVIIASAWRQRAAANRVQNDLRQCWVHLCGGNQDSRCAGWIFLCRDSRQVQGADSALLSGVLLHAGKPCSSCLQTTAGPSPLCFSAMTGSRQQTGRRWQRPAGCWRPRPCQASARRDAWRSCSCAQQRPAHTSLPAGYSGSAACIHQARLHVRCPAHAHMHACGGLRLRLATAGVWCGCVINVQR